MCLDCGPVFRCNFCVEAHCQRCLPFMSCQYPGCTESNCGNCGTHPGNRIVQMCADCDSSYCPAHLMLAHVKYGVGPFCSDCNEKAASQLVVFNEGFGRWVTILEKRYAEVGRSQSASSDFPGALRAREQLRQRCHAVGDKLPLKQKQYERFDHWLKKYELPLELDNEHGGYGFACGSRG